MTDEKPNQLERFLANRSWLERVVLLNRMLDDPELPEGARLPLMRLRSLAEVRVQDERRAG